MNYRSEIDGLRALAVLPVILFHAGFKWFSGGFVGVDVFFVISGYLISTIIISEMAEGKFSLVNFYERRARRILPALFFVMLVCLPFAWLWLLPSSLRDFGQSLVGVTTFSSNILFWLETGYFVAAIEFKPLLHTWSLAVEEQYYILFPLFLLLTWKLGVRWVLTFLFIIFSISLGFAHWGAFNQPIPTFYLLPSRVWELLIGVFLSFYLQHKSYLKSHNINQILSLLGLGMIIYSIIAFDESTPFPSLYALIPTVGTGLLILSAVPNTIVYKLLSFAPIVGVGLISYSAYLWHQPILVFARLRLLDEMSDIFIIILCLFSLIMGYFSWKFIEKPFRSKKKTSRNTIFIFSVIGIVFFSVVGFFIHQSLIKGHDNEDLVNKWSPYVSCSYPTSGIENILCLSNDKEHIGNLRVLFIGDSLLNSSMDGIIQAGRKLEINIDFSPMWGCPALYKTTNMVFGKNNLICEEFNQKIFEKYLMNEKEKYDIVILYSAFNRYLNDGIAGSTVDICKSKLDCSKSFENSIFQTIKFLKKNMINHIFVKQMPRYEVLNKTITDPNVYKKFGQSIKIKFDTYKQDSNIFERIMSESKSSFISFEDTFCDENFCSPYIENKSLYINSDHFSYSGSTYMKDFWLEIFGKIKSNNDYSF